VRTEYPIDTARAFAAPPQHRAEWVLWLQLRDRRFGGFKFVRQQPIGRYYVDFVCRGQRLIVEVEVTAASEWAAAAETAAKPRGSRAAGEQG